MKLNPLTVRKLKRFRSIKRGYYSFIILIAMILVSLFAEILVNKRALIVYYEGQVFFPTYGNLIPGRTFGLDYDYETDYRALKRKFRDEGRDNWVLMPVIPYDPYQNDLREGNYPPYRPSLKDQHYMGTDTVGRDVFARLVYGFRISIFFSLVTSTRNAL